MKRWDIKIDRVTTQSKIGRVFVMLTWGGGYIIRDGDTLDEALDLAEVDLAAGLIAVEPDL